MKKSVNKLALLLIIVCISQIGIGQDITLSTQVQVNNFNSTAVDYLVISGDNITDISLNTLKHVRKGLIIQISNKTILGSGLLHQWPR